MLLTSKGQVTIPARLRKQYGLDSRTEVTFEAVEGGVLIKPAANGRLRRLRTALRLTRGSATSGKKSDALLALTRGDG